VYCAKSYQEVFYLSAKIDMKGLIKTTFANSATRSPDNTDLLPIFLYFPHFMAMAIPSRCRFKINARSN